ncbi:hypothetical protein [Nocardia lasii]|uniref:Uncharacterized protein n=1 Tax=Nocardia lasii TaxID=1616107 RepID=A0ABW1JXZ8_9NOCA
MSGEDSKQLSVAELLARNAAQGAAPAASGGGRRRRSGRGLSVTDLTGENAAVKPNSHAAPAPAAPTGYEPPAAYQPAPYPPPGPVEPAFSPMSGPITRFDPHTGLSEADLPAPARPDPFGPFRAEARDAGSRAPGRLGVPGANAQPVDPGIAEMFGSGAIPAVGGGRRHKPEEPAEPAPPAPSAGGGRAARRRAAEAAEEAVEPAAPSGFEALHESGIEAPRAFMGRPGQSRGFDELPDIGLDFQENRGTGSAGFNGWPGESFDGSPAPGFNAKPATAFNGRPGESFDGSPLPSVDGGFPGSADHATQAYKVAPEAPPAREADPRPSLDRRRSGEPKSSGLPVWSARRHRPDKSAPESGGFPTAAWSPVSQEQPLLSGQSVAGELLRQRADHDADAHTEVHRLGAAAEPVTDDYAESDYPDRDYVDNDYSESDYADGDYDDEYDDYEPEPVRTRAGRRAATKAAASKVASRAKSRAASRLPGKRAGTAPGKRTSGRARADADADNRRQWLILAAQATGAAIAGMLLFKGFETMWERMHWVALALAMVVILGLVALVRVLRRTDDIFSTVIAVVVGVFVTMGPLAFLLSTS